MFLNSNSIEYKIKVLVVYKEGSESYQEIIQNYAQSLHVNTHVTAKSSTEFASEELEKYDVVYPDVRLVDADNKNEIVNKLTNYVKNGGNLFLEQELYRIFPKELLGMSEIAEVNLQNQTFEFPVVPEIYKNLQDIWKIYSVKTKSRLFYNFVRSVYHKLKGNYDTWVKSPDVYDVDLTKIDLKVHALPSTAVSLVNSKGFSLFSVNNYGNGTVLWTVNHIPNRGTYFGKSFITRFDLGYPDPKAKNFNFGYATINYLIRNVYLDFIAKEKYGFSIQKVFGTYGRPSFSWQNHLDLIEVWENDEMIRWIDILKEEKQVPTFSVIRGPCIWGKYYGSLILNLNVGSNLNPKFRDIGSDTPYLLSGTRLQKTDGSYIETEKVAHPFVIDWNEDGKKDLIIGAGDGKVYYYQNVGTNEKPLFLENEAIKEGEKDLNVGNNAAPFVVDWDEDGKKDLIVGAGDGKVYYYQNIGTNEKPEFMNKGPIKEDGKDLNVGSNAAPFVVDWDEDGKKDLIIGAGDGNVYYYQNIGSNDNPTFSRKGPIKEGEKDLNVGSNAAPFVVGWDADGKKDLIIGNGAGNVYYYRNFNNNEKRMFLEKELIRKNETDLKQLVIVLQNASPFLIDWDEDGKKDLLIGVSEQHETYMINSPHLKKKIQKNIQYALEHSICIIPHCYTGNDYTPEQELYELEKHKKAFEDLGIPWTKTMGTNHHAWYVHALPVWQTIYTEKDFGLIYDFGFEAMGADFVKLPCTTLPYIPYGMPFLLMKNDIESYPFIIWTPNTLRDYKPLIGKSGLFAFPSSFDLPITYHFHPENAFRKTKRDIIFSYLKSILKYNTIPSKLDLHSGEAFEVIRAFNKLRNKHEYNMMTEEQAAKAMLNMHYTKVHVKIMGSKMILIPETGSVPETVKEYKNTLGIKIELHPDAAGDGITTDNLIYYKPTSRKIYLGLDKETQVNLNERADEDFHLVRCNVPFVLNSSSDVYEITVEGAGMRQFKIFSPYSLQLENKDVIFQKEGNYYTITDFGGLKKTIKLRRRNLTDALNYAYLLPKPS